jgi:fructan beta-fructosidase
VVAAIRPGRAERVAVTVLGAIVGYDARAGQIYVDRTQAGDTAFSPKFPSRTTAPFLVRDGVVKMRILADRSSIEVFGDDGLVVLTNIVYPNTAPGAISITASGGALAGIDLQLWNLRSTWAKRQ